MDERPKSNSYNYKTLTSNGVQASQLWICQRFLGYDNKGTGNNRKSRQIELNENVKNLCIIQQYQQSKKATHRMGENIYKLYINNRLILRIYRQFLKLNNQKANSPIKK